MQNNEIKDRDHSFDLNREILTTTTFNSSSSRHYKSDQKNKPFGKVWNAFMAPIFGLKRENSRDEQLMHPKKE